MVPAPIRQGAIVATESPAGVCRRTREVGSVEERIKLVGPRGIGDQLAATQFEPGHGLGLQGGFVVERQSFVDAPRFQWEYVLGPYTVAPVCEIGEREMETTGFALVC